MVMTSVVQTFPVKLDSALLVGIGYTGLLVVIAPVDSAEVGELVAAVSVIVDLNVEVIVDVVELASVLVIVLLPEVYTLVAGHTVVYSVMISVVMVLVGTTDASVLAVL